MPIHLAHKLVPAGWPRCRQAGQLAWLRPDGKSSGYRAEYEDGSLRARGHRGASPRSTLRKPTMKHHPRRDMIEKVVKTRHPR